MAAGGAAALVKDEIQVIFSASNGERLIVELLAFDHLGIGNHLTGPVAALLRIVAVPAVISDLRPVVRRNGRILEEDGNLIGLIVLVDNGVVAGDDTAHAAVNEQAHLERAATVDGDSGSRSHDNAIGGRGLATVKSIDQLGRRGCAH